MHCFPNFILRVAITLQGDIKVIQLLPEVTQFTDPRELVCDGLLDHTILSMMVTGIPVQISVCVCWFFVNLVT